MLSKSSDCLGPDSCFGPDLGEDFSFSLLNMMLAMGVSYMAFIMLRYIPSILALLSFFLNHKRMLNFVKYFSASIEMIM